MTTLADYPMTMIFIVSLALILAASEICHLLGLHIAERKGGNVFTLKESLEVRDINHSTAFRRSKFKDFCREYRIRHPAKLIGLDHAGVAICSPAHELARQWNPRLVQPDFPLVLEAVNVEAAAFPSSYASRAAC